MNTKMPPPFETAETPLVDPTVLTTQALLREVKSLRELFEARMGEQTASHMLRHQVLVTRLEAMDKADGLAQADKDRLPSDIDEKIDALREIIDEKFASVDKQFKERDVRTESTAKDSKVAVDAALQAAKEAVGEQNKSSALAIAKSEASTVKQIDQMGLLIQTGNKAVDDKFSDLKDRLTRIEGKDEGVVKQVTTGQQNTGIFVAVGSLALAFVVGAAGIIVAIIKH
jgi:hypothetical protein